MTSKWMLGSALATILVATPALAQDNSNFGQCALDEMTNEQFLGFDMDKDTGLSMDEYRECLSENGIDLDENEMSAYETAFNDADENDDGVLMFAEVEMTTADASSDAPKGTVTVTQPAAQINVEQGGADVAVTQKEPTVAVEAQKPEVSVSTAKPEVAVSQAQPTVAVSQPEPTVSVSQPEPTVKVEQAQPEVAVTPGQPAVNVETQQPEVAVQTPEPDVEVTQPELAVEVEQKDADVAVTQDDANVAVTQTGEADTTTAMADTATAPATPAMDAPAAATTTEATVYQVRIDDLEGEDVMNSAGEEIGEIDAVLLDRASNAPVVILSVGGVLGIGDKEIAFPYDDFTITGDDIVLNTDMTEDEIEDMPEYNEDDYDDLPETMIVR